MNSSKTMLIVIGSIVAIAILGFFWTIGAKNRLHEVDETTQEQWAQISVQLERRADLIPNLVSVVKGYASHEKEIMTELAQARSKLIGAQGPAEKAQANAALASSLSRLLMIAENYPNLKANESFIRLQDELAGTENRIAVARTRYNKSIKTLNAAIRKFPGSLFAADLGIEKREYYEVAAEKNVATPPKVTF